MAIMDVKVELQRRRATAYIDEYMSGLYGLPQGDNECHVLGFPMPDAEGGHHAPIFVCEFANGKVVNVYTEWVKFVDTDEKGEIVDDANISSDI